MLTLPRFQALALSYWQAHTLGRSAEHCEHRLRLCCSFLTPVRYLEEVRPSHVRLIHTGLAYLAPASQRAYMATFKSAWRIAGMPGSAILDWPRLPKSPRQKSREAMTRSDFLALVNHLTIQGWQETADLAILLNGCGLRIGCEALQAGAIRYANGLLHITGKGAHKRAVRVADSGARAILEDQSRLSHMRDLGIDAHRWRWRKAVAAVGIGTALPSPHSIRHKYATELLAASNGNVLLVRDMLGHANVQTTAAYISPDYAAQEAALIRRADEQQQ